jgi:hypothetical protein
MCIKSVNFVLLLLFLSSTYTLLTLEGTAVFSYSSMEVASGFCCFATTVIVNMDNTKRVRTW